MHSISVQIIANSKPVSDAKILGELLRPHITPTLSQSTNAAESFYPSNTFISIKKLTLCKNRVKIFNDRQTYHDTCILLIAFFYGMQKKERRKHAVASDAVEPDIGFGTPTGIR